jgi:hypothetical protein
MTELEKRRNWSFEMTGDGGWLWRVADARGVEESASSFPTLKDCTADAMLNGYVAWKSENERRRDRELGVAEILRNKGAA